MSCLGGGGAHDSTPHDSTQGRAEQRSTLLLEGAAGQLQRGRHCYTIVLDKNAI